MKKFRYWILIVLLIITVYIWVLLFGRNTSNLLEVDFFDVGQGDSILVECCQGKQVLIDGGPDSTVLEKLNKEMGFFDRSIDLVILTHPDSDHLAGLLEVLKNFKVDLVLTNGAEKDSTVFRTWQKLIEQNNIAIRVAQAGQAITLGQGIEMKVLNPVEFDTDAQDSNNYSIVIRLSYGQTEFLFTGDIEKEAELKLVSQGIDLESDVLKVGHHGSKNSTNPLFLQKVNPQIAIISVGENKYGHPSQETLDKLKDIKLFRTDKNGDVKILSDGQNLRVIIK